MLRRACLIAALIGALPACAPPPPVPAATSPAPADFPESRYRQAEAQGRKVLRVDPALSLVVIEVRRAGVLAGLGHDHVVASHDVRGYVDPEEGRSDLYVPLRRLVVDEPGLRAEAKLDTQPSPDAIEGTRRNMLEKTLDAERFPFALIRASRGNADLSALSVTITLHGATRTFEIPVQTETLPGGIAVSGRMTFNQTDFGIIPYSVLGGALQVQDRLDLRFRILVTSGWGNEPN
ncbi:MAG: YceI family protein [Rhodocyclaceae bacterium]|jgi:hypothetical protein|nr:YceI family protein [Rhodocyclaceae bacterium]